MSFSVDLPTDRTIVYIQLPKDGLGPIGGLAGFTSALHERKGNQILVDYPTSFGGPTKPTWVPSSWIAWSL